MRNMKIHFNPFCHSTGISRITPKLKYLIWISVLVIIIILIEWFCVDHQDQHNPLVPKTESFEILPTPSYSCSQQIDFENIQVCDSFKLLHDQTVWTSQEEREFPLAFTIMVYRDAIQVARLLRLIYRPHNAYCIHIDKKAPQNFVLQIEHLAKCYGSNVIVVEFDKRIDVRWGYLSNLQPVLICSDLLLQMPLIKWRYLFNLNGQEFPLQTNWELVKSMKALNGSNVVECRSVRRWKSRIPARNASFSFRWIKGSFLTVLRREFVQFTRTSQYALELLQIFEEESRYRKHPDELFYSTLAHNPHLGGPGACAHVHFSTDSDPKFMFVARYVQWSIEDSKCPSLIRRRGICLLGQNDLPTLKNPRLNRFLTNKFICQFEPLAYDAMENWMIDKILAEKQTAQVDVAYSSVPYANLYCSRHHI